MLRVILNANGQFVELGRQKSTIIRFLLLIRNIIYFENKISYDTTVAQIKDVKIQQFDMI